MKLGLIISVFLISINGFTQELYPYSEPASNMPAKSISYKLSSNYGKGMHTARILQRYNPEVMWGANKNWMLHAAIGFSDMHADKFIFESLRMYAKYRFLSVDEMHKHFRMAAFTTIAYSRNHLDHNELNLYGDHSGVQSGIIATQLWNKFALSGTVDLITLLGSRQNVSGKNFEYDALNYSLSAGYLVFPVQYKDYNQTNVNIYAELLGGRNLTLSDEKYYVDLATSLQFIFNSSAKLNVGYRFQLKSDIERLWKTNYMISYEHIFLNAFRSKK